MATTPVLDRLVSFDERSRNFPIRELVGAAKPRSRVWACSVNLDQGDDGECVGFAIAQELAATPVACPVTPTLADLIYRRAQKRDEWPGENYVGTSVLGGMRAGTDMRYYGEYRWAFNLNDLVLALSNTGPAVLGMNWYESMMEPGKDHYVRPSGKVAGGHAILCRGVSLTTKSFLLHNSWGSHWGLQGTARITFEDLDRLLHEDGEAAIPVQRFNPSAQKS